MPAIPSAEFVTARSGSASRTVTHMAAWRSDVGHRPDSRWAPLLRVGAISAGLFVLLILAAIALAVASPAPPTSGGAATLDYIAAQRTLYMVHQQLWLVPGVFAAVMYLALYAALAPLHRSLAALGCAVGGVAWALTLAMPTTSTGAPALVYLSDQYAATGDPGQRAAFAVAAEGLIAINRTPTAVGILTTVGMLIVSLVMLRGVFARWVAHLGIATGLLGIVSEALRPVIEGGYAVYGVLLLVWIGAVGWRLARLATEMTAASDGNTEMLAREGLSGEKKEVTP
jgi:hypothetical protein